MSVGASGRGGRPADWPVTVAAGPQPASFIALTWKVVTTELSSPLAVTDVPVLSIESPGQLTRYLVAGEPSTLGGSHDTTSEWSCGSEVRREVGAGGTWSGRTGADGWLGGPSPTGLWAATVNTYAVVLSNPVTRQGVAVHRWVPPLQVRV